MAEVESFALDHTKVKAPYVRLIAQEEGPKGDVISNFDLRLVQPNQNAIPTAGLHTIEHLLAGLLRDRLDGVIDCSPFGCRTGFHLIVWGAPSTEKVAQALASSLTEIRDQTKWADVPGTDKYSCGNFKDHSLTSAKEWAAEILEQGISSDPDVRKVVSAEPAY
ncbi:S-ribosylhomocysteine lyase [Lactobacillaceae bacterium L1_55_11]|nr:S-ribosylhomocysteine lyase [Lactobacillaceae bacterium L1_55_11]